MKFFGYLVKKIGLEVLTVLFFLVRWLPIAFALTYALRWLGFSEGINRIINIIWFIVVAIHSIGGYIHIRKRDAARQQEQANIEAAETIASAMSSMSRREQAIQSVMAKNGLTREEVEASLRGTGL